MEWIADPTLVFGFFTLVILEIVLGIDNLVFIAIIVNKLPPQERDAARKTGLTLALLMRILLLSGVSWLSTLNTPLFYLIDKSFSGRDLILLVGGLFLLFKATVELHHRIEQAGYAKGMGQTKTNARFWPIIMQIIILDAVFSIDSIITAVGMTNDLPMMVAAVIIAILTMMFASNALTTFINKRPTLIVLCLGFLLMIGCSLVAEGFGFHIPKGYLYAAIGFSLGIELLNHLAKYRK